MRMPYSHELRKHGLHVEQQRPIPVYYDQLIVGDYLADIVVEESVLVELTSRKGY